MNLVKKLAEMREDIPGGFAASKYMTYEAAREAEARWWITRIKEAIGNNENIYGDDEVAQIIWWLTEETK